MKVIFLDIDGTLVDMDGALPDSARQAVRAARAAGNKIYLTTGRCRPELYDYILEVGFDGFICANGAYIEEDGCVLLEHTMSPTQLRHAVDWLRADGREYLLEGAAGLFGSAGLFAQAGALLERDEQQMKETFPDMIFDGVLYRDGITKISFCLNDGALERAQREFAGELEVNSWTATGIWDEFGELALPGTDKVNGLRLTLERLGLSAADAVAVGDAQNDIDMLSFCGTGVAMGNAVPRLKEVADFVTADVRADGLCAAFARLGLN